MDPLTIMGLIKFVPDVVGLFNKKRGKDAKKAIETVGQIAEAVTGQTGSDAEKAIAEDPSLAYKFQLAVMADSHIQEQLELEDRGSAREMYKVNPEKASNIAEHIMKYNLVIIFILVIINILAIDRLQDAGPSLGLISNVIGLVMGGLLSERQAVTGFYFGSSLGSKLKNEGKK